jgi:hypothetical protein
LDAESVLMAGYLVQDREPAEKINCEEHKKKNAGRDASARKTKVEIWK